MAIDLKPYFESARAASDEVQRVMAEMNAAFSDGTDEGKQKALDLRPALDAAQKAAEEANALYISMRNASSETQDAAKNFVPASMTRPEVGAAASAVKEMTRAEFTALDGAARMAFIRNGGKVID
jgi:hypothetical protein